MKILYRLHLSDGISSVISMITDKIEKKMVIKIYFEMAVLYFSLGGNPNS